MTWVRIDDKLTTHPKWLALSGPSELWWLHAAVWCGAHNNDGIVPEHAWPLVSFTAGVSMGELPAILDQLTRKPQALPSDDGKPNALMSRVPKARWWCAVPRLAAAPADEEAGPQEGRGVGCEG